MNRFFYLFVSLALLGLMWSCSEDSPTSSDILVPDESLSSTEDSEEWIALEKKGAVVEFEIILENLTPATEPGASQPFSPPVFVTHKSGLRLYKVRHFASDELRQIAEDAVSGPMIEVLNNSKKAFDVVQQSEVILPQTSAVFTIKAKHHYNKLSMVSMLVNTNDAFTGVSTVRMPYHGKKVYYLPAYDAGTEKNTELRDHIPGPCCGNPLVRVPTRERIKFHRGILGIGELDPEIYDWKRAVAKMIIKRIY